MKVLVLGAGAGWSTKDVENGVVDGLRAAGVSVGRYAYEHRLATSADYLQWVYRRAKKREDDVKAPSAADVQLHALGDMLIRAMAFDGDFVVVVSGMFVPYQFLQVMRRAAPIALVLTESPYQMAEEQRWAALADVVWTNERSALGAFRSVAPSAHYLPHAWRPSVHVKTPEAVDADVPAHDVVFVGTGFDERIGLLEAIDWTGIDLGLYGNWQRLSKRSALRRYVRGSVTENAMTAALYRRAKVGLNLYREHAGWSGEGGIVHAESMNPRAYELAATGCFHVSSHRAEVKERLGHLVPTFRTASECEDMIRGALSDERYRLRVASELPAVVADDTWLTRGRQMVRDLEAAHTPAWDRVARQSQRVGVAA